MARVWVLLMAVCVSACAVRPSHDGFVGLAALQHWTTRELPGKRPTQYSLSQREGQACVLARARESVSLWRRPLTLSPEDVHRLEFEWWLPAHQGLNAQTDPELDDAPARLVIAFDGDESRLSARNRMLFEMARVLTGEAPPFSTLMYVWDPRHAPETVLISSRTDRIRKIVVSGDGVDRWQRFNRDVSADFRRAFGEAPGQLVGAALMTDADNTQSHAEACYGNIRFVDQQAKLLPGSLIF